MREIDAEAIVVGAGFGGIGMAIELKKQGVDSLLILERAQDAGGVWRDNVYPGCACDIPSMLYSFSFEPGKGWTRTFPEQREIWNYLHHCIEKYGLREHLRYGADVVEARYDDASATWQVQLRDGSSLVARFLILAAGALNRAAIPAIPGLERFAGTFFHSSHWDASIDVRGKDVVAIGTGASAIQIVPAIAGEVRSLTVFQRTPAWVMPRGDRPVGGFERWLRRWIPGYAWFERRAIYWSLELRGFGFFGNTALLRAVERVARRHLERQVADPALRAALAPEYRMGCKRVLLSDDFYPALQRENVELVTAAIAGFDARSIRTDDGREFPADIAIFATGFDAADGIGAMRVFGRAGVELANEWKEGMSAYLGTSVAKFPNLFLIVGPNTGLGHNSMIEIMESQFRFICAALASMRLRGVRAIDVKPEAQAAFNAELQERLNHTVWNSGCRSWYLDERGKNTTLWPGFTFTYRRLTKQPDFSRYELLA